MLIDTHCHLDAPEFEVDRQAIINQAVSSGVRAIVVPAVCKDNFYATMDLANKYAECYFALGWHPMYIGTAKVEDIPQLKSLIGRQLMQHNKLVAVGEIGLDLFVDKQNIEQQTYFFIEQLKLASAFDLPVILHVRSAIDEVLKYLRRYPVKGGIAHAFNGSLQQAEAFIKLGFKLGFGGAMTYPRALKIRSLASQLDLSAIVLETDAPDIPPAWLGHQGRNSPHELPKIAEILADIRGVPVAQIVEITGKNALDIFPKLAHLCTPLEVLH